MQDAGFATLFVMVIASILLLLSAGILNLSRRASEGDIKALLFYNTLDIVQANLFHFVENTGAGGAWERTVTYNQTQGRMTCVNTVGNCPVALENIVLVRADNSTYYDPTTQGFRSDASVCNYNAATVTNGCVLRVQIQWTPMCSAACLVPPNTVLFYLTHSTPTVGGFSLNVSRVNEYFPVANPYR